MPFRPSAPALHRLRFARVALLWLALAIGLAQAIAVRHAYSHAPGESPASTAQGKHAGGLAHCHSCIVAASVGGGAPPAAAQALAIAASHRVAIDTMAVARSGPQERPYAIRAPPALAS